MTVAEDPTGAAMRAAAELYGVDILGDSKFKEGIIGHFTTGDYGWMWPFPATLEGWYAAAKKDIERSYGR